MAVFVSFKKKSITESATHLTVDLKNQENSHPAFACVKTVILTRTCPFWPVNRAVWGALGPTGTAEEGLPEAQTTEASATPGACVGTSLRPVTQGENRLATSGVSFIPGRIFLPRTGCDKEPEEMTAPVS